MTSYLKSMKPGSSISLQRGGNGEYDSARINSEPAEVLSFVVCYGDKSGEELQSVRISREQLKDVQKTIGEYLERMVTEDVQSVEATVQAEPKNVDTAASVLFDYLRWCNADKSLSRFDSQLVKIERYLEETAQENSPKNEADSIASTTDSKDVDKKVATLLDLVDWCREMNDVERYDKNISHEEALTTTKVIRRYILSSKWIEKVPKESISKLCVSRKTVELEAFKIHESTEAIQKRKQQLADTNIRYFKLNPDCVKITKSTTGSCEYFAEITCILFSLKVGGHSPEEARANLDERFAELTQTLLG